MLLKMRCISVGICICLLCHSTSGRAADKRQHAPTAFRDRCAFAQAMKQIQHGMTLQEVNRLLGSPDQMIEDDSLWPKVLAYGSTQRFGLPTLGEVYLDENDRVIGAVGKEGIPPDPSVLAEKEVRELLLLLDQAPDVRGEWGGFDPRAVIRIVNTLQPLGKAKALAAIQEYTRIKRPSEPWRGMHLILRALFDLPESGHFPAIGCGVLMPEGPRDPNLAPRFPLVIVDDIPVSLARVSFSAGGQGTPPDFTFFRDNCRLRQRPLLPTSRPFSVVKKIMLSNQWIDPNLRDMMELPLIGQLCKLTSTVYRPTVGWAGVPKEAESLDIHWDPAANCYVFRDGSTLTTKKPAPSTK